VYILSGLLCSQILYRLFGSVSQHCLYNQAHYSLYVWFLLLVDATLCVQFVLLVGAVSMLLVFSYFCAR